MSISEYDAFVSKANIQSVEIIFFSGLGKTFNIVYICLLDDSSVGVTVRKSGARQLQIRGNILGRSHQI